MLTLPRTLTLTPAQFAEVCAANPEAVLELDALGHLIEMPHREYMEQVPAFDEQQLDKCLADSQRQGPCMAAMASQHNLPMVSFDRVVERYANLGVAILSAQEVI